MKNKLFVILVFSSFTTVAQVNSANITSIVEKILEKNTDKKEFLLQNKFFSIQMGNLFSNNEKSAVVILFDSIQVLTVYNLIIDSWVKTFEQSDVSLNRILNDVMLFEDFNFDGQKDMAYLNGMSNGAAICYYQLWIATGRQFVEIKEFQEIGSPKIISREKTIHGFTACCVFGEMNITQYFWEGNKIHKKSCEIQITNYPSNRFGLLFQPLSELSFNISKRNIRSILDFYSGDPKMTRKSAPKIIRNTFAKCND